MTRGLTVIASPDGRDWRVQYRKRAIEGLGRANLTAFIATVEREAKTRGLDKVTRFWAPWPRKEQR